MEEIFKSITQAKVLLKYSNIVPVSIWCFSVNITVALCCMLHFSAKVWVNFNHFIFCWGVLTLFLCILAAMLQWTCMYQRPKLHSSKNELTPGLHSTLLPSIWETCSVVLARNNGYKHTVSDCTELRKILYVKYLTAVLSITLKNRKIHSWMFSCEKNVKIHSKINSNCRTYWQVKAVLIMTNDRLMWGSFQHSQTDECMNWELNMKRVIREKGNLNHWL